MLVLQKDYVSLKAQVMIRKFNNKIFLIKSHTLLF